MVNKGHTYRLSPLAEADLEKIWLYTFRQWSLEQADEYYRGIVAAIEGLASGRKIGQRTNVREGYWKYKIGMHVIYFRCTHEYLDVIRILHGRMDVNMHLQDQG
jgi:toxin ParE1/3/4